MQNSCSLACLVASECVNLAPEFAAYRYIMVLMGNNRMPMLCGFINYGFINCGLLASRREAWYCLTNPQL